MVSKREHPKFRRPNYGRTSRSRIKIAWRRPRGIDNKKGFKFKYMGASPNIGYGQPSSIKGRHPQGMPEVLAQTPADLNGAKGVVVRIAAGVGAVKREAIQKLAEGMKLKVVNPKKFVLRVPKPKADSKGKAIEKNEQPKSGEAKKEEAPKAQEPVKQKV